MSQYLHTIQYYETDRMGITHHSNYIRFLEEARLDFLSNIGYPMTRLEAEGITSPVVGVTCNYKQTTTYGDAILINVSISKYTNAKLEIAYTLQNAKTGALVATAASSHCFINEKGRPVALKKAAPELDAVLRANAPTNESL